MLGAARRRGKITPINMVQYTAQDNQTNNVAYVAAETGLQPTLAQMTKQSCDTLLQSLELQVTNKLPR